MWFVILLVVGIAVLTAAGGLVCFKAVATEVWPATGAEGAVPSGAAGQNDLYESRVSSGLS